MSAAPSAGRRGAVGTAALLATGVSLLTALPAAASPAGEPVPPTPGSLPSDIEPLSPYQPETTCSPTAKPGVVSFEQLVLDTYPDTSSDGIVRACDLGGTSEHKEGRAFDWAVSAYDAQQAAEAQSMLDWLLATDSQGHQDAMARRLGVMYIIWNDRIWGSYRADEGWRPYSGSNPHTDHVHFSFDWAGADRLTSYWTGTVAPFVSGPVAAPPLAPTNPHPTLRLGASGAAVATLQALLRLPTDGIFGPATRDAVVAFQNAHNLTPDGVVGDLTWAALDGAATSAPTTGSGQPVLREGATGGAVATLQRLLRVPADGIFGPQTTAAVTAFQRAHSLGADGIVGPQTWAALGAASAPPAPPPPPPPAGPPGLSSYAGPLRLGSSGAGVSAVQQTLHIRTTGSFDPATRDAVVTFQKAHQLLPDGVVGPLTWAALRTAATATAAGRPVLREGDSGAAVVGLQQQLHVPADGTFGPQTTGAVVAFQRAHSLGVDGIVGPQTWAALGG